MVIINNHHRSNHIHVSSASQAAPPPQDAADHLRVLLQRIPPAMLSRCLRNAFLLWLSGQQQPPANLEDILFDMMALLEHLDQAAPAP